AGRMWRHTTGRADTGPCPRRHAARGCSASVTSIGALAGAGLRACGPPRSVVGFQPGTDAPPGGSMRSSTTIHHSLACLLSLAAAHPLQAGPATLDIEFTHLYGTRAVGLYRALRANRAYLFTQFEADDAREAFPCWDEPGFKFPYQLVLEVPAAQKALSNTPP